MCRTLQTVVVGYVFLHLVSAYAFAEGGITGEGESCDENGKAGTCTRITNCHVYTERGEWWKLKICGFVGFESVICCPARASTTTSTTTTTTTTTPKPVATTPPAGDAATEYIPPIYDEMDECPNIPSGLTTEPIGKKSWDKCIEYQMQLIYPCEKPDFLGGNFRRDNCWHSDDLLIVGGYDVHRDEFPHMVLLGYGRINGSAVWRCGGTLISDRFILTAAHCTRTKALGYVNYAIVGSLKRTDNVNPAQVYRIQHIIKHPDFNLRTRKNDIALLKTDPIRLGTSVVPACLDVFGGDHTRAVATGWGAPGILRDDANTLQKTKMSIILKTGFVTLTEFTDSECRMHYPVTKGSTFDNTTQVCYGDYYRNADICQGDSGGPLTIRNQRLHCMYTVVGITSFGLNCGTPGQPGWFTKVSHYVPWIESIVWP